MIAECCAADETPLCSFNGLSARGSLLCDLHKASDDPGNFCQGQADATDCPRLKAFQKLDNQASNQYQADVSYAEENINSLVFNTFIFMQVSRSSADAWLAGYQS